MELILKALPVIAELSAPVIAIIIIFFLVAVFLKHIEKKDIASEKKDEQIRILIDDFRGDMKELSKERSNDTQITARAIEEFKKVM